MPSFPTTSGYHDITVPLPAGDTRVTLYLPELTDEASLVIALHYGGQPVGHYGRGLLEQLIVPAWDGLNAVFVAPVAVGGDWRTPRNYSAVTELAAVMEAHYATCRRILVGYSMGAIGCWHFLTNAFNAHAVVPIAGQVPDTLDVFTTPTYALHSHADQLFPSDAVEAKLQQLRAADRPVEYQILSGVTHFDIGGYTQALRGIHAWLKTVDACL